MLNTRFTRLVGCSVPIQLAGMGGGVVGPELAAAVSAAGGLGMIGQDNGALADRLDALDALGATPYGVNFLAPFLDRDDFELATGRVRLVELFWMTPDAVWVERIHRGGALAGWQVGSVDEAKAAADAGCDIVVVQGVEAGGHVRGTVSLLPLLTTVLDAIADEAVIVASGGIGSARSVAAALAAGADAVRIGSRFVASTESRAHPDYKAALVDADLDATVLNEEFGRPTGWPDAPNRVLRSALARAGASTDEVVGWLRLPGGEQPIPIERFSGLPPTQGCEGDIGAMALYAGQSVAAIDGVLSTADIMRDLMAGAEALLKRAAP